MWARFLVELMGAMPSASWRRASEVTSPIRSVKDADEIERLRAAGAVVDRIATRLQRGEIELLGRTEAEVSAELGRQVVAEGHDRVNFAIVAAGANAASPHHEPGGHAIGEGEVVLCDFGGTMIGDDGVGYCSDITRCVYTGEPPAETQFTPAGDDGQHVIVLSVRSPHECQAPAVTALKLPVGASRT